MTDHQWIPNNEDEFTGAIRSQTEELYRIKDRHLDDKGLMEAPVIPLKDIVIYPQMVSPLFVRSDSTLLAIDDANQSGQTLVGLNQIDPKLEEPEESDFYKIGVELAVGRMLNMPDGSRSSLVQGRRRVQLVEITQVKPYMKAIFRPIYENISIDHQIEATMRNTLELFQECVDLDRTIPEEAYFYALNIEEPGWLADMIVMSISHDFKDRVKLLQILDPVQRLDTAAELLAHEIEVVELENEIHTRTQSEVDHTQREYYLREQLKVIQTELGDNDPWITEINELKTRIESVGLPEEAELRALKEVNRLTMMPPVSPEVGIIRTYLDWLLELPWSRFTDDNLDVAHAENVLETNHYGLPKAKERILEYIAVKSLHPEKTRQPILCFVGPPGTGKTSLGRSIAEALGRKFVRISLGGIRDEAEIRGHRRTYIGALPGRILQTIKRAGYSNPLFMLDEIDKLGLDYRGDPASALLEVLDPEQNFSFSDHYLEISFDVSRVMFITTANTDATIPAALLDRMEIIEFPGYIEEEKIEIAQRFLIPKQIEENGLQEGEIRFSTSALLRMIREYTYEAGVRNLEREIARICRKVARKKAEGNTYPSQIGINSVEPFLGPPQFFDLEAERDDEVGVATAIAWTSSGGEIMPVEVVITEGKGNLQLTGQLGEIMQESAQAALSYLKSRSNQMDIDNDIFENSDIHIHIPEGSIPKDGPSAGITIATALASALTGRKVRRDVGMTGEITLRGRVLPVGGVREKVLAAHRAGIKRVLLPTKNQKDLVDIPKKAKDELEILPIDNMDDVLSVALCKKEKPKNAKAK